MRKVGSRKIELSNLDKVLYPNDGITKRDVIDYYDAIGFRMVPEVKDRPMTLERYPDGIAHGRVFTKAIPKYFPEWIARKTIKKSGGEVTHVVCNDRATLVYLANQACLTQHIGLSRIDRIDRPDHMIFDFDPSTDDFAVVRNAALRARELLEDLGFHAFVKTTGSRGLHVMVPLARRDRFEDVRSFAYEIASFMAAEDPKRLTVEQRKVKREDRLFVDFMRNAYAQTAVAPYSLRARDGAPVAMPLEWDEVSEKKLTARRYTIRDAADVAEERDPWKGWRRYARTIKDPRERFQKLFARAG
jgi:bifunctional non-homologous end joining protein LigD